MIKTIIAISLIALAFAEVPCGKGCYPYQGICACDQAAKEFPTVFPYAEEKPPEDKMPSYQREGIHADMPPSCAATNTCSDQKAIDAAKEGGKAAGL